MTALGNPVGGFQVSSNAEFPADDNVVGGTVPGAGNVIANNGAGVLINGADAAGNRIVGNSSTTTRASASTSVARGP